MATIFDVRRFLIEKIKEFDDQIDTRSGSGVGNLLIKPLSLMLRQFVTDLDFIRTQLSLEDVAFLGNEATDELIANLFIERRVGNQATGSVRIFFASPQESLIPAGTGFLDGDGQLFTTSEEVSISAAAMSVNREGSQFYVDVPVESAFTGDSFNIAAGEISATEATIVGAIRVTNPAAITGGITTETNEELVDRAGLAITVRNLINRRSISTVLLNEFNIIQSLQPIGYRDPEMIRDLITVTTSLGERELNIGGHADIYIEPIGYETVDVDIPASAMTGNLTISTNVDRATVTSSVKPGLFIDITAGWFGEFEVEEQYGVELDPSSTYYIYLDVAGVLQLDSVGMSFPSNSIPIAVVTTDPYNVTSVTDSREDLISFPRPMISIESVVELDPVSLSSTERLLSDGLGIITDSYLPTEEEAINPYDPEIALSVTDDLFLAFLSEGSVYVSGYDPEGNRILDPVLVSGALSGTARNPFVEVGPSGKLNVVFEHDDGGQYDPYYARLTQAGAIEVVAAPTTATSGISSLAITRDETGNLHLGWIEGLNIVYQKIDEDGVQILAPTTVSSSPLDKAYLDVSHNGNAIDSASDGYANASNIFQASNFPLSVTSGQTLVLTGGNVDFSAILDGTESEPGPFSAFITGSIGSTIMDTSSASGYQDFEVIVDGVTVTVSFTDTAINPVATVAAEINAVSLLTALATNIATVDGDNRIVITSPATGITSTVNVTVGNDGLGFVLAQGDQGGFGYDTSIVNGTNTMDLRVDGETLNIVFDDTRGRPLVDAISDINTVSLASSLATSIAFDGGGYIRLQSPGVGVDSFIEVVLGNSSLGFVTDDRSEGGSELGRKIGIVNRDSATQLTLAEDLKIVTAGGGPAGDIEYRIDSVEAALAWAEDGDVWLAKLDDIATLFLTPTNLTHIEVQASKAATGLLDFLENGLDPDEIVLNDDTAEFITNGVVVGDTVRVTSATPISAEGDYLVKRVESETELILEGTLSVSPATSLTYEIFKTQPSSLVQMETNSDNEHTIVWVNTETKLSRIETDRLGDITIDQSVFTSRPNLIGSLDIAIDSSETVYVGWTENNENSGDPHLAKLDEFGDLVLDPVLAQDSVEVSRRINVLSDSENQPCMVWESEDCSVSTKRILVQKRQAQDYFVKVNDPACALSTSEDSSIVFTREFLDQPIRVTYKTSSTISSVDDFVQSNDQQIIDANYKTKSTIMAKVYANISYSGNVEDAQQIIIDYINGIDGTRLELSDLSNALYSAGADYVSMPSKLSVRYYDVDGSRVDIASSDVIEIPRVARFFADEDIVLVTQVSA
jgi:hypothetical protein